MQVLLLKKYSKEDNNPQQIQESQPKQYGKIFDGTLPQDAANPILTLVYNVLGVVVFMGIAWICWNRYEKKLNQK